MACHAVDKKLVGPAYKEVAAKYKDQKDAVDTLAVKIMKGGSGVWGPVPMPANNAQVSEADAKKLAAWVLTKNKTRQQRRQRRKRRFGGFNPAG
jgi:cytochrome c